jgi:hypothetical protein
VVWAVQPFTVGEDLPVKGDGLTVVVCQLVGVGEVAARRDGLGMTGAENAVVVGDGLLMQRDGAGEVAEGAVTTG